MSRNSNMAAPNPFSLLVRPASQWEVNPDSAMHHVGLPKATGTSTSAAGSTKTRTASDPFEAVHRKWEDRGLLIQKHERRISDSNKLLSKMWRRLDPYGRVLELLNNNAVVQRHAERRAEPAYSEVPYMQSLFYQLAAYDYIHAVDPGFAMPPPTSQGDPALSEQRLNSMAATVKIQSGLLQEKNDTIEKLRAQLDAQRKAHLQLGAHLKDKDDALDRLEKQLQKANSKISVLRSASQPSSKSKPIAVPRAPRARPVRAPVVKLPETAFGGIPENHTSLTFNGFSEQNAFNPARLQMLTAVNPPAERASSVLATEEDMFEVGPQPSGANCAPLGPPKRRYDSAVQSSRSSRAPTPESSRLSSNVDISMCMKDVGSKRAVSFLDYDDPEDAPEDNPKDSKRIRSGVLTPPLPEDLVMATTEESGGEVSIKHETDLEMGEIEEAGVSSKYAYEDLDELIHQAQMEAMR